MRTLSIQQSKSIVEVIFENARVTETLSDNQHAEAREYYSAKLSIRDRKEIVRVLCRGQPDNFSQIIRDVVAVYDPFIRELHQSVDLSAQLGYAQAFMDDIIKTIKSKASEGQAPSVEEFDALIQRHVHNILLFLHEIAKKCPDWADIYRTWCKEAASNFRRQKQPAWNEDGAAGEMTDRLGALFKSVPEDKKTEILSTLDAHAAYLAELNEISARRAQAVLDGSGTMYGPGAYIARWHDLLEGTRITPATAHGQIRTGKDIQFADVGEDADAKKKEKKTWWDSEAIAKQVMAEMPREPEVSVVLEHFRQGFRDLLKQ